MSKPGIFALKLEVGVEGGVGVCKGLGLVYPSGGVDVSFRVRVYCWKGQDVLGPRGHFFSRGQQKPHIERDLRSQPEVPPSDQWQAMGGPLSLAAEM